MSLIPRSTHLFCLTSKPVHHLCHSVFQPSTLTRAFSMIKESLSTSSFVSMWVWSSNSNYYLILLLWVWFEMHMHSNVLLSVTVSPLPRSRRIEEWPVIWSDLKVQKVILCPGCLAHLHKQSNEFLKPGVSDIFGLWFYNSTSSSFKSAGWMASHFDDLFKQFVRSTASCTHMIQNINVSCRCNFSCQLMHHGKMTFMLERCDFSTNSSL